VYIQHRPQKDKKKGKTQTVNTHCSSISTYSNRQKKFSIKLWGNCIQYIYITIYSIKSYK
jgi:hypothetical protein